MKDLRAERSIRKQPRVTYEIALRAKTPSGGEILTRKAPARHGELPSSSPSAAQLPVNAQHTLAHVLGRRAAVTPYVPFSIKLAQSWLLGAFSFQRSMEKLGKELSLNPPCPQTPAYTHTHTRAQSSAVSLAVGICKAQVWFGGCCDGSEDSCSQWADPMTKRKKRRQTTGP